MEERGDTIAAIATAPGRGGVAVVRVSGPAAFRIGAALSGREPHPGRVLFARFSETRGGALREIDDGLLLSFKAPHSYTGEDVVEFQCHGGSVCPRRVLEAAIASGARLARRGEFTERAFLNGRLDINQAESVLDLIDARTDRAADDALAGLSGARAREVRGLYDDLVSLSSTIEHSLDVDEGDLPEGFAAKIAASVSDLGARLRAAEASARERALRREGALVVIAGAPNAGKSSLLNALVGEERAIVSATPGTTRDSIETWIDIDGWPVRLVDTAGIRKTDDAIEGEGVKRAEALMEKADVVVFLDSVELGSDRVELVSDRVELESDRVGLESRVHSSTLSDPNSTLSDPILIASKSDLLPPGTGTRRLRVSAKTGEGLEELKRAIVRRLEARAESAADSGEADEADRLASALAAARAALPPAAADGLDLVLAGNDLRRSAEALGAYLGAVYSADLLDALFSRFCVGK